MTDHESLLINLNKTVSQLEKHPTIPNSIISIIAEQLLQINPNQLSQDQINQLKDSQRCFTFYLEKNRFYENEDQDLGYQLFKFIRYLRTLPKLRHINTLSPTLTSLSMKFFEQACIDHKQCSLLMSLSARRAIDTKSWQIKLESIVTSLEEQACLTLSPDPKVIERAKTHIHSLVDNFIKDAKEIPFINK